jgi:hypothetical protein
VHNFFLGFVSQALSYFLVCLLGLYGCAVSQLARLRVVVSLATSFGKTKLDLKLSWEQEIKKAMFYRVIFYCKT